MDVDVVVVSYRSGNELRACVESLEADGIHVTVVDNASGDGSLDAVADLDVTTIALPENRGFAAGCNAGWRASSGPYVLFLNPDALIEPKAVEALVDQLERDPAVGVAAPRIVDFDGSLEPSQRRFPTLRSTYAHALFLHRLFRRADWASELVRDRADYERPGSPDWVSGACLMVRRSVLEELGGWDERFFMYCEDKDLCCRARDRGYDVRFEPAAVAHHAGGASAPRPSLAHVLAQSRVQYARKHHGRAVAELERAGIALTALTHMAISRGGRAARAGHAAALRAALSPFRAS